ncbi:MAG: O-antigen ligase family protein [Halanaerobiales bacterium]|nr:O-antigen ligase family protein [Halanaerobiales bacterium]
MKDLEDKKIQLFFEKAIIVNLYFFSLGTMVSKALTSISGALVVVFWILRIIYTKGYSFKTTPLDLPILCFISTILLSGIGAFTRNFFEDFFNYTLLILLYYAIINTIKDYETLKKILLLTIISVILASLFGLYQYYVFEVSRVSSFMLIIGYGGVLSIAIIFAFSYLLWGDFRFNYKLVLIGLILVFGLNLLFTKARGAWLAFIGSILLLSWIKDKRLILVLVFLILLLGIFLPSQYTDRFFSIFDLENDNSNQARIILWQGAFMMWKDHLVNGVGAGNFKETFETNYMDLEPITTDHAHNNFLQFAAETGTLGFIAFSYLMVIILKVLFESYNEIKRKNWRLFLLSSFVSMVSFNISGLTEFTFGVTAFVRFFWFLLALSMVVIDFSQNREKDAVYNY